ncbi:patatin-like phospholipase family protein [Pedobacter rhodius]|uniref:Patatin-like phospholipase family protein n=1 Tax=Pedobacter rhodius TaxID=3004098 RepID=A0ABT4KUR3_9SPHI|nr:patatin-like phospholipase family protein [Pedobacter sp. SJ11]MCZ4222569.1 patatin-like phospholipase family protein [Pedobacter sp. SJ11]
MAKANIKVEDFIADGRVQNVLQKLRAKFGDNYERLVVSDTLDDREKNQYVNLVQKGGGVLGVALVGYTYILEAVGIRFLRLAGTSAGAINTALMTVIDEKNKPKSEKILKYLCEMDFFSFVDGHPFARWLIKNVVSNKSFKKRVNFLIKGLLMALVGLFFMDILFIGFSNFYDWGRVAAITSMVFTGIIMLIMAFMVFYAVYIFEKLKVSGYGINPGNTFLSWIKQRMDENGVSTVAQLNKKASTIPNFEMRPGSNANASSLAGDVTFIVSELVTENKIQLPLMADLFRVDEQNMHPGEFVRASMSIPIFFESHMIRNIPVQEIKIQEAWDKHLKIDKTQIPSTVRFVDGGMLSNFPVSIFYNPKVLEPRLPVFGIDLDDVDPKDKTRNESDKWSLTGYIWKLFNTVRYYYDKDFLEKNLVFKRGIGSIKLFEFNWLNFFLTDKDKLDMFCKGAEAAGAFLENFDWQEYKRLRTEMQINFNQEAQKN